MSTAEASRDGVWVRKAFDAERFPDPVVVFRIQSLRNDPVTVTVSDPVPTAVPTDAVKFHPEFDADNWRATGDRTVEYERRLDAGETVTTLYAAAVDPETARRHLMGAPTVASVTPDPAGGDAAEGTADAAATDPAPDGDRDDDAEPSRRDGAKPEQSSGSAVASGVDGNAAPDDGTGGRGGGTAANGGRRARGDSDSRNRGGRTGGSDRRGESPWSRPVDAAQRAARRATRGRSGGGGRGWAARYGTPQSLPLAGAAAGAVAFLFGFLGTYLLASDPLDDAMASGDLLFVRDSTARSGIESAFLDGIGVDPPGTTQLVAWLYHDLHGVAPAGTFSAEGGGQSASYDVVMEYGPDAVLYVLPPLALAVGGFLAARYLGYRAEKRAVKAGMSVGLGYAALSAASAVLLSWEASATRAGSEPVTYAVEFGADPVGAVLVAGLLYPALFGAVGGYVAAATAGRPS
ncbi:hypothetical protein [Halostella litorea]|uniref:hypothetical protein n=1 Tax=Halostella litorea TaxID=2528831 RepID=UPI001092187C|nr:hypothetical protein [Halostella litorea]